MRFSDSFYSKYQITGTWLAYLLFFMMLFLPAIDNGFKQAKMVLMLMLTLMIFLRTLHKGNTGLHASVFVVAATMIMNSFVFILIGALHDNPGATAVAGVYVVWPVVYMVYVSGIADRTRLVDDLIYLLIIATIAIGLFGIYCVLHAGMVIPDSLFFDPYPDGNNKVGFRGGYIRASIHALPSLMFLVPFTTAAVFSFPRGGELPVRRSLIMMAMFVGSVMVLLSGRKALIIVALLAPLFTFAFNFFRKKRQTKSSPTTVVISSLLIVGVILLAYHYLQVNYDFDITALWDFMLTGFDFEGDPSAYLRKEQYEALLNGWYESPLFGGGHGASALGSIRDPSQPWGYELYFLALLYQTGLVGFMVYLFGVVWIYWMGIKIIASPGKIGTYMLPVLVGTSCFLLAGASNPYLDKYDYLWVIFLPVALINCWLLDKNKQKIQTSQQVLNEC